MNWLKKTAQDAALSLGWYKKSWADEVVEQLPVEDLVGVRDALDELRSVEAYTDPKKVFSKVQYIEKTLGKALGETNKKDVVYTNLISGSSVTAYRPAGSALRKLFPGYFGVYGFASEAYWACMKARREVICEVDRDSYVLLAKDSTSKLRIKQANAFLNDLGGSRLRWKLVDHLGVFGNAFLQPKRNNFGGLIELNLLLPEHMEPVFISNEDKIAYWMYLMGNKVNYYAQSELNQLQTYSCRSNVIGLPAMSSVIVDIEAAMHGSIYNNTAMQKGGLISTIVSLESPKGNTGPINDKTYEALAQAIQNRINKTMGGVKGSGQIAVLQGVKNVHGLAKIGEMDGAFHNLDMSTAAKVANIFGVPPARLGIPMTSQYQNGELVDDTIALSFDNNQYFLTSLVDEYLTEVLAEGGFPDIMVQATGEYSSISLRASQFGKFVSEIGAYAVTVDEFRVKVLHWEPLGGAYGSMFLGELFHQTEQAKDSLSKAFVSPSMTGIKRNGISLTRHKQQDIRFY